MSYDSCERSSTGATPQSFPDTASALLVAFTSGPAARQRMFHLCAPSLSLSQRSSAFTASRSGQPTEDRLHGQIARHSGTPATALRSSRATHPERSRQSCLNRVARARTEAWLNRGHAGRREHFIWNIISTVCFLPSSRKPMACWCPTDAGEPATLKR